MPAEGLMLLKGDFFEVVKDIPKASVDFVFADPPYFLSNGGISVSSGKQVLVDKGSWDKVPSHERLRFHEQWIGQVSELMTKDASIVISGTYHSAFHYVMALESLGFQILNDIVWFKPNGAPNISGRRLAASHELLIWAAKSKKSRFTFNYKDLKHGQYPGDEIKKPDRQMRSVWWIPTTPKSEKTHGHHPTQKPLALMDRIIAAFTSPESLVLDPFMGSGTTGVAALRAGRRFIGIEKSEEYFQLAEKRIEGVNQ